MTDVWVTVGRSGEATGAGESLPFAVDYDAYGEKKSEIELFMIVYSMVACWRGMD